MSTMLASRFKCFRFTAETFPRDFCCSQWKKGWSKVREGERSKHAEHRLSTISRWLAGWTDGDLVFWRRRKITSSGLKISTRKRKPCRCRYLLFRPACALRTSYSIWPLLLLGCLLDTTYLQELTITSQG